MKKTKGIIFALISSGTFGLIPLFSIPLLKEAHMHAPSILFYRSIFSAIIIGIICLIRKKNLKIPIKTAIQLVFLSMLYTMTAMGLIISYNYIPSGVATTIHFLYPVVVSCFMILFFKEKKSLNLFFAAVLAIIGVAVLCWSDGGFLNKIGIAAVLMTVFTYSTYIVSLNRPRMQKLEPEVILFYVTLFGGIIFCAYSYFSTGIDSIPDIKALSNLMGLVLFATIISATTLLLAIKNAGPTITSILGSMEPVVAVTVGFFFFSESFGWNSLIGLILIIGSVLLVIITNQKKNITSIN